MFLSKILRAADHPYLTGHGGRKVRNMESNPINAYYDIIAYYHASIVPLLLSHSQANNDIRTAMQGMTMKSIKHHVALQPLFVIMGVGITFVCLYVGR